MRMWLIVAVLLLLPSPGWAQDIIGPLRDARSAYPTPMSKAQLSEMLNRAASQRPGWGMLRKDSGNNCPTPYPGVSISCDWLVYAPTRWGYDVLRDQEGAATIVESGGEALGAGMEIVYPWPTSTPAPTPTPGPQPVPVPMPTIDLSAVLNKLQAIYDQNERTKADEDAQRKEAVEANARAHAELLDRVDNPGWFKQVFGSRYTQMILAGVATWLGTAAAK